MSRVIAVEHLKIALAAESPKHDHVWTSFSEPPVGVDDTRGEPGVL